MKSYWYVMSFLPDGRISTAIIQIGGLFFSVKKAVKLIGKINNVSPRKVSIIYNKRISKSEWINTVNYK